MAQWELCLFSLALLWCSVGATVNEKLALNPKRTAVVDRLAPNIESAGYFLPALDRTAFTVDHHLWLHHFDIPKVYLYDPNTEIAVDRVPIRIKFVKISNHTSDSVAEVIFVGRAFANSTHETSVKVPARVPLHPGFVYEIRLKMPENTNLMYNEFLDINDFKIKRFFGKTITVSFYLHNPVVKPPNPDDKKRRVSHGLVKRLRLKYSWF